MTFTIRKPNNIQSGFLAPVIQMINCPCEKKVEKEFFHFVFYYRNFLSTPAAKVLPKLFHIFYFLLNQLTIGVVTFSIKFAILLLTLPILFFVNPASI